MQAPRPDSKTPIQFRAPAAKLALAAIVPLVAVLALSPLMARPAFLQFVSAPAAHSAQDPFWVGHLDNQQVAGTTTEPSGSATSTSYTTGFDPVAVGLVSPKAVPGRGAQLRPCADEATDKPTDPAHVTSGCNKSAKAAALPLPRPAELKPVAIADTSADKPVPPRKKNGLFGFMPHLPSAGQLLSPFTFVGDKVSSLFKRS
ncbi:MAG: hypothetical protein ACLPID_14815 [Beijerinckiaceae bacterium]